VSAIVRRLPSPGDDRRGVVTYLLDDGRYLTLEARDVQLHGLAAMAHRYGVELSSTSGRLPVRQCGLVIGTVPTDFDPMFIRSKSRLYDPRPSDFIKEGNAWVAEPMLGPGDFEAIEGFAPA